MSKEKNIGKPHHNPGRTIFLTFCRNACYQLRWIWLRGFQRLWSLCIQNKKKIKSNIFRNLAVIITPFLPRGWGFHFKIAAIVTFSYVILPNYISGLCFCTRLLSLVWQVSFQVSVYEEFTSKIYCFFLFFGLFKSVNQHCDKTLHEYHFLLTFG